MKQDLMKSRVVVACDHYFILCYNNCNENSKTALLNFQSNEGGALVVELVLCGSNSKDKFSFFFFF